MKTNFFLFLISVIIFGSSGCQKSGEDLIDATANYPKAPGSFVRSHNLSGVLKGTLKADSTYYLTGSVTVNKGDTLAVEQGATIIAKGNFNFQISGTFLSLGTEAKPITFTSGDASRFTDLATYTGHWGGFLFDSTALYVYVKYTHINFTGGPDSGGGAQATFDVEGSQTYNGGAFIIVEDSWMYGGVDDGIHLAGNITASIKRNVLQRLGGPDGESMNIKKGVKWDIAYNYIWSAANSGIKLETGSVLVPQTNMNIFNNTIIDGGWRKVGEATNAILIDKWTRANIFNNIIVGNHTGINITTKADDANCTYGNNLIYEIADTMSQWIYPAGAYSVKQSTDVTGSTLALCNSVFTKWVAPTVSLPDNTLDDGNVPSLASGSPAIGKGIFPASFTYFITSTDGKKGTADMVNKDLGAYPTDGSGNKHLPTARPLN
jgi:hypothetical protein